MRKSSSKAWLKEHHNDPYVKQSKIDGYRSRAVYKLLELQTRDKLFKQGMIVLDLGAAPGGWSQVLSKTIGKNGRILAIDLLPIEPIPRVECLQGDFLDDALIEKLAFMLNQKKIDWVLSDMAPNMSGINSIDQPKIMCLAEHALQFSLDHLNATGGFLIKIFQGEGFDEFLKLIRQHFKEVSVRKPKASRDRSREIYIIARKLKVSDVGQSQGPGELGEK
jgi:23S rRNA (uridine2552-2'-O)-methyltransferase